MIIIWLLGPSGAGKTSLSNNIISALVGSGMKVAYVKDIPHDDARFDSQGKDTAKALNSGASVSVGRSPSLTFASIRGPTDLMSIVSQLRPHMDVCIAEGFHEEGETVHPDIRIDMKKREKTTSGNTGYVSVKSDHFSETLKYIDDPENVSGKVLSLIFKEIGLDKGT